MAEVTPPKTLQSIHFLRGLASLLVVLIHALGSVTLKFPGHPSVLPRSFQDYLYVCASSVDFFFLISGFTMFYVYAKDFRKPFAWLDFLVRRAIRIVPMYWLISALYVAVLLFAPGMFATLKFEFRHAIESFLFIPTTNSAGENFPVLNVGWTLSYEMYFYALFGIAMLGTVRFALWAMGILFTLSVLAAYVVPHSSPTLYVLFNQLVLEFFLGGLAAYLVLRGRCFRVPGAWGLIVAGITLFAIQFLVGEWDIGRLFTRGVPALLILAGLVSLEVRGRFTSPSWLLRIGDECYSLYLSHSISLALFFKGVVMWGLVRWLPVDMLIPPALLVAVLGGRVIYLTCEKPLTRSLNAVWRKSKPTTHPEGTTAVPLRNGMSQ